MLQPISFIVTYMVSKRQVSMLSHEIYPSENPSLSFGAPFAVDCWILELESDFLHFNQSDDMILPSMSHDFIIVSWFPDDFPMIFQWIPMIFQMISRWCPRILGQFLPDLLDLRFLGSAICPQLMGLLGWTSPLKTRNDQVGVSHQQLVENLWDEQIFVPVFIANRNVYCI